MIKSLLPRTACVKTWQEFKHFVTLSFKSIDYWDILNLKSFDSQINCLADYNKLKAKINTTSIKN